MMRRATSSFTRQKRHTGERTRVRQQVNAQRPTCEAGRRLAAGVDGHRCAGRTSQVHEIQPGNPLAPANLLSLCDRCAACIAARPEVAIALGLTERAI